MKTILATHQQLGRITIEISEKFEKVLREVGSDPEMLRADISARFLWFFNTLALVYASPQPFRKRLQEVVETSCGELSETLQKHIAAIDAAIAVHNAPRG